MLISLKTFAVWAIVDRVSLGESTAPGPIGQTTFRSRPTSHPFALNVFIRVLVLLALHAVGLSAATAADPIVARAFVEDPTGRMRIEAIRQQPAVPFEGLLTRGYSRSIYWVRLTIDPGRVTRNPASTAERQLVLRIRPAFLDDLTLFDPLDTSGEPRQVGALHPWLSNEYPSVSLTFMIPAGAQPRDVWLRVQTDTVNIVQVEALPLDEATGAERRQDLLSSLYLSSLGVFLAWSVIHAILYADRVLRSFAFLQLTKLLFSLSFLGYLRFLLADLLTPAAISLLGNVMVLVLTFASTWFFRRLLLEYEPPVWMMRLHGIQMFLPVVALFLVLAGRETDGLALNALVGIGLAPLTPLLIVIFGVRDRPREIGRPLLSRRLVIVFLALLVLMVAFPVLAVQGRLPDWVTSIDQVLVLQGLFSSLIGLAMMQSRVMLIERNREYRLAITNERADQAQQQRIEQSRFIAMLTHELKTPLSVIRMSVGMARLESRFAVPIDRAIRDMNDVIERCLQVDRLGEGKIPVEPGDCDVAAVAAEVVEACPDPSRVRLEGPGKLPAMTDATLLRMILANLVDNAFKYGSDQGTIEIEVAHNMIDLRDCALVTVRNRVGRAGPPDPHRVFHKYYRAPDAHERIGSGLGLYLTWHLAQLLGGEMRYLPNNERICFQLCLPR